MLKALVFDFDGVIVNTEPLHHGAFQKVLKPDGLDISWDDYVRVYIGYDDRDTFRERFQQAGRVLAEKRLAELMEEKSRAFHDLLQHKAIKPYPGVVELILAASDAMPVAICSGARRSDIDPVLRSLKLTEAFDVIISADDVAASKPEPESYEALVKRLQVDFPSNRIEAADCVAIEDTPSGVHSARRAGLHVIGITNTHPPDKLSESDVSVRTLEGLTLEAIRQIFG